MKKILCLLGVLFIFSPSNLIAQKNTISGYIEDANTGERMVGVNVVAKEVSLGTTSNTYGFYSMTLPVSSYTLEFSFIGYETFSISVDLSEDAHYNVSLKTQSVELQEIVLTGEESIVKRTQSSVIDVPVQQIKSMPSLLGEVDVLKTIQFLPGVSSGGEGNTGFYVRGGGPDQNLILLDEAVVYNASHLFGFFSVFNADAIKDINIIKGGMPAEYGGRLSSVLDITMKDGNNKKYEADGGIGLLSSRLTLQGPIQKEKSSFILSGRRTYIDVLSQPFLDRVDPETGEPNAFAGSGYYFYDLTSKINYRVSDKDRLYLSGYFGRDVFSFANSDNGFAIEIPWGNATGSLRWNHLFSDKLFMNTSIIFSDYRFEFNLAQSDFEFKIFSGINDWNTKVDFLYQPNQRHTIKFGANYTYHIFTPGNATGRAGDVEFAPDEIFRQYSNEGALYFSNDFELSDELKVNAGLRYSSFQHRGDINLFTYLKNDLTLSNDNYRNIEPRLSLRYKLNTTSSIKGSYSENYQYIHLASTSSVSLPTDLWVPSSTGIKPKFAKQYALGYFKNFNDNMFETSLEGYYKEMTNLIEYREGYLPEDNTNSSSDDSFTFGDGDSYGIEVLLKKNRGKTTGWIGYTLSKTTRYFDEVNNGIEFPAKYDRRHDLSITATHQLSNAWVLSGVFVYATGNSITLPTERYVIGGDVYTQFTARNGYRTTPYHRMDIGATYTPSKRKNKKKKNKKFESTWNFSIYNVYSRKNPYFIYFALEGLEEDGENQNIQNGNVEPKAYQVSIFPILPSVTWNFNF